MTSVAYEPMKKLTRLEKKRMQSAQYYADPEYRAKHLAYVKAKVTCPACNVQVARCNVSKHKRTQPHQHCQALYDKAQRKSSREEQLQLIRSMFVQLQAEMIQE